MRLFTARSDISYDCYGYGQRIIRRIFAVSALTGFFLWQLVCFQAQAAAASNTSPEKAFYRANMHYEAGDYDEAIKDNRSIIAGGLKSGNIYYNLGNCFFKKGETGRAILNYERALRFNPRDSDLLSNHSYVKTFMKRQDPPREKATVLRWLDRAFGYLTLKQAIMLIFLIYYFLISYVIVAKVFKRYAFFSTPAIILLLAVLAIMIVPTFRKIRDVERGAIVVSKITDTRFEPLENEAVYFPLYEGMKVDVLRSREEWHKVKRPDGKIGWVPARDIEIIGI